MLHNIVKKKKNEWLQSRDCSVSDMVKYIRERGFLRDTQIEAIETYLFLKIQGENRPLWQLFSNGFFTVEVDLAKLEINQHVREYFETNKNAYVLYDFAQKNKMPELEKVIKTSPETTDYDGIIKDIFYNVSYADYLMSLPMGAGKTYLMAAFIYLDLYFAQNEPENKAFAHNFLVLVPSGLKSSIVPSLRTIENFDPSWILPEPAASNLKKILKFEILDEQKTSNKSNKARNPNAQKVNACLPNPFGQVFVVNAEKVILESFKDDPQGKLPLEKEKDTTNDLKALFGQIPNLSLFIDEVHHAATDDIKLRQAVNYWHSKGNITTVLGFSGTPYLTSKDKIKVGDYEFRSSQITNTVYYYPLVAAIEKFLKKPEVKIGENLDRKQIIQKGIENFDNLYKNKKYDNGSIPKLAIYCSSIDVLESEVYPFLIGDLCKKSDEILRFHKGNKQFPQPTGSELEFRSLDLPISKKRYILLVQIGKEGWDCPSLTGVILSQKGDSPQNMVLQTSCRCLRQVDNGKLETALIWLNEDNAKTLNNQLKQEQNTSILELNNVKRSKIAEPVMRYSRIEYLNLPKVDFYQMKVTYQAIDIEKTTDTQNKLLKLIEDIEKYKKSGLIHTSGIENMDDGSIEVLAQDGKIIANFNQWIFEFSKESFGLISQTELYKFNEELKIIFERITYEQDGQRFFNESFEHYNIQSKIRLAFSIRRNLQTESEIIPEQAELLITSKLKEVEKNDKLYPEEKDVAKILEFDSENKIIEMAPTKIEHDYQLLKSTLEKDGLGNLVPSYDSFKKDKDYPLPVKSKNSTFHYLPYNFGGSGSSGLELETLKRTLKLVDFEKKGLEIYYNGERCLTEFVINCFAKNGEYWKNIGKYTTDFLILKRKNNSIYKALLIETKGNVYAKNEVFQKKKNFVATEFLKLNRDKFGYQKFDFLYLEDGKSNSAIFDILNRKINDFFNEES
jgi:type III restriction enzyme